MKILVISLAGVGDTVLATPLLRELRANYPDAQLDALVFWAASKDILEGNPNLNTVYQCNLVKEPRHRSLRYLLGLRKQGYDISLNAHPQSRIQYRMVARLIGAPLRFSHRYECSGWLDRLLVNRTLPQDYSTHTVDMNLAILGVLGKKPLLPRHELELFLSPAEHQWAESFLAAQGLSGRQRLGIHIGSGGTKNLRFKRWPVEQYIELLVRLRKSRPELAVLLFGGPEEEADLQRVMAAKPSELVMRVPSKNLRQAGAILQRCTSFLSVDTALMHVAAAVKAPRQLVIEACTFNKTNEPYGNPYYLIKNPAVGGRNLEYYRYDGRGIQGTPEELVRCMQSVTVEAVYEAVMKALV
jgi:ADP-heptose:LPS heptosyltransferase